MIGTTLNHYEVLEKLGEGGMGHIYLAEDTRLHRQVALKVLPSEMATDAIRIERFEREAQAVAALNHPNIVTIFSVEEADGVRFLTMELVDGKPLDDLIPFGGLDLDEFFDLAVPLASAVAAAHRQGITHRDIKPANVMVNSEGVVKLLDLGLAKLKSLDGQEEQSISDGQTLTQEGRVIGTVPYMAPEQLSAKPADHRVDIFALGVVLYQMLTGIRPFQGNSSAEIISSILRDSPQPITEHNRSLPTHLGRIVRKSLEKDPANRFSNADELRDELQTMQRLQQRGELRTPSGLLAAVSARQHRRAQWLIALGVVLGVAIVTATVFSVASRPAPSNRPTTVESRQADRIIVVPPTRFGEDETPRNIDGVEPPLDFPQAPAEPVVAGTTPPAARATSNRSVTEEPAAEPTREPAARPTDSQMSITLSSASPSGVVTLYADDLQIYRRPFDFTARKTGFLGRVGLKRRVAGELEDGLTVPAGTDRLRLYVALTGQAAKQFVVEDDVLRGDGSDVLTIAIGDDGALGVHINGDPVGAPSSR